MELQWNQEHQSFYMRRVWITCLIRRQYKLYHHLGERLFILWYPFIISNCLLYPLFILSICWIEALLCSCKERNLYAILSGQCGKGFNWTWPNKLDIVDLHSKCLLWIADWIKQFDLPKLKGLDTSYSPYKLKKIQQ
jgi:hypothetical protein